MAEKKASRVKSALGGKKEGKKSSGKKAGKKQGGKKHVHKMHISRTDNGKFLVEHEYKPGEGEEMMPNERHALNPEELQGHIQENMELPTEGMGGARPSGPMPGATPTPPNPMMGA